MDSKERIDMDNDLNDNSSENLLPDLRFKGFSEPWIPLKVNDIVNVHKGATPSKNHRTPKSNINWFNLSELGENKYLKESKTKITEEGLKNTGCKIHPKNSIFISSEKGDKKAIIKTESSCNEAIFSMEVNENFYYEFVYYLLDANYDKIKKIAIKTIISNVPKSKLEKIQVLTPSYDEQIKIGDLLKHVDEKISLLKDKKENFINSKEFFLEQLFEQKSRFKNFNDEWIEYEFKDFLKEDKTVANEDNRKKLTVKQELGGVVAQEDDSNNKKTKNKSYLKRSGEFIYVKSSLHKGSFGLIPEELDCYTSSSHMSSFEFNKKIIDPNFFYYFMSRRSYYKNLERLLLTGSKQVSPSRFLKLKLKAPSLEEQEKIVELIDLLDQKIDLLGSQINETENLKKYLLQNLFVKI